MDNTTATACEKCHALIFYDKDAPEPKLCPVCAKLEGWAPGSIGGRKWHYYRDGRSLCVGYMWLGKPNFEQGNDNSADNCAACKRKRLDEIKAPQK